MVSGIPLVLGLRIGIQDPSVYVVSGAPSIPDPAGTWGLLELLAGADPGGVLAALLATSPPSPSSS